MSAELDSDRERDERARRNRRSQARWIYAFALAEAVLIGWAIFVLLQRKR